MPDNEKQFEQDIESFLISPAGGWQKASDAGYQALSLIHICHTTFCGTSSRSSESSPWTAVRRHRVPMQGRTLLLQAGGGSFPCDESHACAAVSYTHLDVYKRQPQYTEAIWMGYLR